MKFLPTTFFFFTILTAFQVTAETFKVMLHTGSFPPYFFKEKDTRTGIIKDVFSALAEITGDTFEYERVPFKRSLRLFEVGKIDLEPMVNPIFRQSSSVPGIYSIPYTKSEDIVLFNAENYLDISSPEGLFGEIIGTIKGYHYPSYDAYFTDGQIEAHPLDSEAKIMQLLQANRLQQALINKDYALYQIKHQKLEKTFRVGPSYHQLDMMIRFHPNKVHALNRFNQAIKRLLDNGTIKQIYRSYQ